MDDVHSISQTTIFVPIKLVASRNLGLQKYRICLLVIYQTFGCINTKSFELQDSAFPTVLGMCLLGHDVEDH